MKTLKLLCIMLLAGCIASLACAEEINRTAVIEKMDGLVEVKVSEAASWEKAKTGMVLKQGDIIRTMADSTAVLTLDGVDASATATVEIAKNSKVMLAQLFADSVDDSQITLLDVAIGEILIKANKLRTEKSKFEVKTPTSIVGVRGTSFKVKVEAVE